MFILNPNPNARGQRLAFGLTWAAYDSFGVADERRRFARKFSATHYVEVRHGEDVIGGFCSVGAKDGLVYSGALRIAQDKRIPKSGAALVLIEAESQVLSVFIVDGIVRRDSIIDSARAKAHVKDVTAECDTEGRELAVFGSGDSLDWIGQAFSLRALSIDKKFAAIKKLPFRVPAWSLYFAGLSAVVALFYAGTHFLSKKGSETVVTAVEPPATVLYQRAARLAIGTTQPLAAAAVDALVPSLRALSTHYRGFQVSRVHCDSSGLCTAYLKRVSGTYQDFSDNVPAGWTLIGFDEDGKGVTATIPAVRLKAMLEYQTTWPERQDLIRVLQTPAQRLSDSPGQITTGTQTYHVQIDPPQILPTLSPKTIAQLRNVMQQGTWSIHGDLWQTPLLHDLPNNMSLTSFEVTLDEKGVHFIATGNYYVNS